MRAKYIEQIISFILSIIFYVLLIPIVIFLRNLIGIESNIVFAVVQLALYLFVYGIAMFFVTIAVNILNQRLMKYRKDSGGRDIVGEEKHEDESGMISLSLTDKK